MTLRFNAALMRLQETGLYHSFSLVKIILNFILGGLLYELERKVELMAQVIFRRLQMPACESKVLTAKKMLLLMQFHILRVATVSLLHCDVPSSRDPPTQSSMKTIGEKLRCFALEPNSLIQQLFSET
jgi:hypothetical protein